MNLLTDNVVPVTGASIRSEILSQPLVMSSYRDYFKINVANYSQERIESIRASLMEKGLPEVLILSLLNYPRLKKEEIATISKSFGVKLSTKVVSEIQDILARN